MTIANINQYDEQIKTANNSILNINSQLEILIQLKEDLGHRFNSIKRAKECLDSNNTLLNKEIKEIEIKNLATQRFQVCLDEIEIYSKINKLSICKLQQLSNIENFEIEVRNQNKKRKTYSHQTLGYHTPSH